MAPQQALRDALDLAATSGLDFAQQLEAPAEDPSGRHSSTAAFDALHGSRKKLAEAATRLLQLATDPKEYLEHVAGNYQQLVCLRWLVNLSVLEHIPLDGPILYSELARLAHVPEKQLKSVARMAITHAFLAEPEPGFVSHSSNSALLVTDSGFMNWARFMTNYSVPTALKLPDATQRWGKTEAKDECAFNLAMDVKQSFFDHLRENKEMNSMFSSYMRNVASTDGVSLRHLVQGFDWASLPKGAKVIDCGGSGGHVSVALAKEFAHLDFVVQDLPETVANSEKQFKDDAANLDLGQRVKFMPNDFFQPQPVVDADVYLLRMIIHDYAFPEAVKILTHLKAALKKPGSRIVIMDTVLPQPGEIPLLQERQLRARDLMMTQVFNAKEREIESWKSLVKAAGLRIKDVSQPSGSVMGVLRVDAAEANDVPPPLAPSVQETDHVQVNGHTKTQESDETLESSSVNNAIGKKPVLIVGAGIGGLCLAQALQKGGIDFRVFERDLSVDHRPQGYRLKFEKDTAQALRESLPEEVYEDFETSCATLAIGETDFDPINGFIVKSRAGGGLAGQQGLQASYTADRSTLRRILLKGLGDKVSWGKEIAQYDVHSDKDTVVAHFKDGTTAEGSFLVGADGVRSGVRKHFLPIQKFVDTGAICIYGKTPMTPELLGRFPEKGLRWMTVCIDNAPLIQSILIGESPLTLLAEPIRFENESRMPLPESYVYWVLIGRKEIFVSSQAEAGKMAAAEYSSQDSARLSLELTKEWDPSLRALFELQDVSQCSTLHVVSASPDVPKWKPSPYVTLLGDSVHPMSPCGGVGANTAVRDASELAKLFTGERDCLTAKSMGVVEEGLRQRAFKSVMRSFAGSKKMFDQRPFDQCAVVDA